jgi:hypothetical protein
MGKSQCRERVDNGGVGWVGADGRTQCSTVRGGFVHGQSEVGSVLGQQNSVTHCPRQTQQSRDGVLRLGCRERVGAEEGSVIVNLTLAGYGH